MQQYKVPSSGAVTSPSASFSAASVASPSQVSESPLADVDDGQASPSPSGSEQDEFVSPEDERYARNEAYSRESQLSKSTPLKLKERTFPAVNAKQMMHARSMPTPSQLESPTSPGESSEVSSGDRSRQNTNRKQGYNRMYRSTLNIHNWNYRDEVEEALARFERMIDSFYQGEGENPVTAAIRETIKTADEFVNGPTPMDDILRAADPYEGRSESVLDENSPRAAGGAGAKGFISPNADEFAIYTQASKTDGN